MSERCPPGPSSIGRYAILLYKDMEFSSGCEMEARRCHRRPQVKGLKEVIGRSWSQNVAEGRSRRPRGGDRAKAGSGSPTRGSSGLACPRGNYAM
jgi:hypothetical protein